MTGENTGLSVHLLMTELKRGLPGKQAWVEAGYCLDAPEIMVAGSTVRDEFGPDEDDWIDMPSFAERDVPNGKVTGAPPTGRGEGDAG